LVDFRVIIIDPDPTTTKYLAFELTKAGLEVYSTNNAKEGLVLAYQQRPHVIILEPITKDIPPKEFLSKIKRDRRTSRSRVIAFSSLTSPQEIQAAIDLPFYHYMAKEGASVPLLIEKVTEAAEAARAITERQPFKKKTGELVEEQVEIVESAGSGESIVFLSAKGGIGTSSICANLAHVFNPVDEERVALMDLVLPIGSIASIVGYDGPHNIIAAASQSGEEASMLFLDEIIPKPESWNFQLLAGSPSPDQANQLDISKIPLIINNLKRIYDYVFVDIGKSLSRISLPIITSASQIVLLLSLDQPTVTQTKSVWDYLKAQGVPEKKFYFLINRAVGLEGLTKSEVDEQLGIRIPLALPHMGRDFSLANNLNLPVSIKFPQDAVTFSLVQAAEEIKEKIN
jgi:MinD-like ATPase involved in chromosome partitioning or flagellar assembly/CheY-like chemotaxis protein